jgi:hypothetical protein
MNSLMLIRHTPTISPGKNYPLTIDRYSLMSYYDRQRISYLLS